MWKIIFVLSLGTLVLALNNCVINSDCENNAYCKNEVCRCQPTHVEIDNKCLLKFSAEQSGCVADLQCSSVWAGATCEKGTCQCAGALPAFPTPDGLVCVDYGHCPLGSDRVKFQMNKKVVSCMYGLFYNEDGLMTGENGQSQNRSHIRVSDCPETYDCICSTSDCLDAQGFCCPSIAYSCIQQYEEGTGNEKLARFYYDSITEVCKNFTYRGNDGNSNNFETIEQCESHCVVSCNRGRPKYSYKEQNDFSMLGQIGIEIPSIDYCNTTCNGAFSCESHSKFSTCCPTIEDICSLSGGLSYGANYMYEFQKPTINYPFDVGHEPYTGAEINFRYFYDETSNTCRTFPWVGQGGNFNQFLTLEQCERTCQKND